MGDERGHNCPTERKEMEVDGSRAAGGSSQAGPGWRSPPTSTPHWTQPVEGRKEVLQPGRWSSGGGWRSDGFGQNFWGLSFQKEKGLLVFGDKSVHCMICSV